MSARLFDKVYMIVAAIASLAVIIVLERYMAGSGGWKHLLLRFSRALGIMMIVLAIITGITQAILGDLFRSALTVLFLLGPAFLGAVLITVSSILRSKDTSDGMSAPMLR